MRPAPAEITDQIYRRWWADVFAMLVAMLVDKRRISLDRPTTSWSHDVLAEARISLAPLTAQIAVNAGELRPFPGDPVDRILTATAVEIGVPILTKDTRIRSHARGSSLRAVW
jgi:PIN domain nuclease of toxin-antitoxin system